MSIRSGYLFAEVAGRVGLTSYRYFHFKQHTGSLPSLIAAKSHIQDFTAYPANCLRPLTPTSHKATPKRALFHSTAKMSALEEDGSSISAQIAIEDKLAGGRKPRGGGRGGRGGGGGGQSREVQVSKTLSKLLRHQAANAGIKLDAEGFAALDEVVSYYH
jgi:hypothetical protein